MPYIARESRVRELEAAHVLQAVEAAKPSCLLARGGQRPLGVLVRGETGVCGPFCWVWSWRARRLPDSCFRCKEPPVPRARRSEVPGGALERRDWNQAGVVWVWSRRARETARGQPDSCNPSKRPPVPAPGRKQPRQTPKAERGVRGRAVFTIDQLESGKLGRRPQIGACFQEIGTSDR